MAINSALLARINRIFGLIALLAGLALFAIGVC
jgi:hypothetical protein